MLHISLHLGDTRGDCGVSKHTRRLQENTRQPEATDMYGPKWATFDFQMWSELCWKWCWNVVGVALAVGVLDSYGLVDGHVVGDHDGRPGYGRANHISNRSAHSAARAWVSTHSDDCWEHFCFSG